MIVGEQIGLVRAPRDLTSITGGGIDGFSPSIMPVSHAVEGVLAHRRMQVRGATMVTSVDT
jgi:hypothetical protein